MKTLLLSLLMLMAPVLHAADPPIAQCKVIVMVTGTQLERPIQNHLPDIILPITDCENSVKYHASGVEIKFLKPNTATESRVFYPAWRLLSVVVEPIN